MNKIINKHHCNSYSRKLKLCYLSSKSLVSTIYYVYEIPVVVSYIQIKHQYWYHVLLPTTIFKRHFHLRHYHYRASYSSPIILISSSSLPGKPSICTSKVTMASLGILGFPALDGRPFGPKAIEFYIQESKE